MGLGQQPLISPRQHSDAHIDDLRQARPLVRVTDRHAFAAAVSSLVAGRPLRDAAKAIGISRPTLQRYLKGPKELPQDAFDRLRLSADDDVFDRLVSAVQHVNPTRSAEIQAEWDWLDEQLAPHGMEVCRDRSRAILRMDHANGRLVPPGAIGRPQRMERRHPTAPGHFRRGTSTCCSACGTATAG